MKQYLLSIAAIVAGLAMPAMAQQPSSPAFEKKEFTHSAWTKEIFSEAATVKGAGKLIFLAGVGSEDEMVRAAISATTTILSRNANMPSTRSSACLAHMAGT